MNESALLDAELGKVIATMINESHRGCVLVGVSLVEWKMAEALTSFFRGRHNLDTELDIEKQITIMLDPLHEKSILGAAAARARMCRILGLISEETHRLLKDVLRFRNHHFAHFRGEARLTDQGVRKSLHALNDQLPLGKLKVLAALSGRGQIDEEQRLFMRIIIYLFSCLHGKTTQSPDITPNPTLP